MSGSKAKKYLTVQLTRAQSRMFILAANRWLKDRAALPAGPDRNALEVGVAKMHAAREGDEESATS